MRVSHRGLVAIEGREGIRLKAYRDSKGLPTIGVGHLIVPGDGFSMSSRITQEQCDALFAQDVRKYENAVNSLGVTLSQNQFDALVSFCLNIGTGGFKGSTIAKRLKAQDYNGAAQAMMKWVKPPEITGRRKSEQKQFLTPYPKTSAAAPASDSQDNASRSNGQSTVTPTLVDGQPDTSAGDELPPIISDTPPETPVQSRESTSVLTKLDAAGDKVQSINATAEKFQVSSLPAGLGTKLSVFWKQVVLPLVMMFWGWITGHWEICLVVTVLMVAFGTYEWIENRKRNNPVGAIPAPSQPGVWTRIKAVFVPSKVIITPTE